MAAKDKQMDKDMKSSTQITETGQQSNSTSDKEQISNSRRKFAKSVAGSGVILSLASKPVMGANYWCTGSGGMSGNTSSHGTPVSCLACTPGFWKTCPENWPAGCYAYKVCDRYGNTVHKATKFADVFGSCASGSDKTMMWVLKNQNGTRDWHACGAYLNAAKAASMGLVSAYTVFEIKSMYSSGAPASTFSSTYEGSMHNCPMPNTNSSTYEAESLPFCNLIDPNGDDTGQPNPACGTTSYKKP